MIGKGLKRHYVLIKDFNIFMYYYTLHRGGTRFCHYCLQAIKTVLPLKLMVRKGEYVGFKNY